MHPIHGTRLNLEGFGDSWWNLSKKVTSLCFSLPKKTSSVSDCSVQSRWDDQTCITSCASTCNTTNQDFSCPEGWIHFYKLWIDKFVEMRAKLTVLIPGLYSVCKGTVYLLKKVQNQYSCHWTNNFVYSSITEHLKMIKQILLPEEKLKDSEANARSNRTNCFYPILFSKRHELLFWCCLLADQII